MDKFIAIFTPLLIFNIPSMILIFIAYMISNEKPKLSKILYIIGGVYLVISFGFCITLYVNI
jgi:hypothetical protein